MSHCMWNNNPTVFKMKDEISAAVLFLTRLIAKSEKVGESQVEKFQNCLHGILVERFKDHWFPDTPCKGQAYRCIRINQSERRDPILNEAAQRCGVRYEDLKLPVELTIWVDPLEVCCRFGEHKGSYCTVASFKNGNKENFVDKINIEELEFKSEQMKKPTIERVVKRKKSVKKSVCSLRKPTGLNQNLTNGTNLSNGNQNNNNILQQLSSPSPVKNNYQSTSNFQFKQPPPPLFHAANLVTPVSQGFALNGFGSHGVRPLFIRPGQFTNSNLPHPPKFIHNFNSHPNLNNPSLLPKLNHLNYAVRNDKFHWFNNSNLKH